MVMKNALARLQVCTIYLTIRGCPWSNAGWSSWWTDGRSVSLAVVVFGGLFAVALARYSV